MVRFLVPGNAASGIRFPKTRLSNYLFDQGLQVLTDALAAHAGDDLCLNTKVTTLAQDGAGQWQLSNEIGDNLVTVNEVLLCLPAYRLAELQFKSHWGDGGSGLGLLKDIFYPPVSSVVLGFKREDVAHPLGRLWHFESGSGKSEYPGNAFSRRPFFLTGRRKGMCC